ncbi:DUF397 domain-containing protein [Actinomadura kijaniata]|uniref:DUF397 domain-containing protein n=1 Tax=Actinomadura kijaniata TaxID=46161 RepID=UPI000A051EFA|nr:DUF397 domain-containing protein [Actinomadura kijaniata]
MENPRLTRWRTSSYTEGQDCVQVADLTGEHAVAVRDSKDPHGPMIVLASRPWTAFVSRIKQGERALSEA